MATIMATQEEDKPNINLLVYKHFLGNTENPICLINSKEKESVNINWLIYSKYQVVVLPYSVEFS